MLLVSTRQRNAQLTRFAIEIGPLNAEGLRGLSHFPAVVLKYGSNVVALKAEPRVAQIPGRNKRRVDPIKLECRQQLLDLNHFIVGLANGALDNGAQFRDVAGPVDGAEQRERRLGERSRRQSSSVRQIF